jgi:hypothetical protein
LFSEIKVNDSSAAAFTNSNTGKGHAGFTKSTRATHDITHFRFSQEFVLEGGVVFIRELGDGLGKGGEFNK